MDARTPGDLTSTDPVWGKGSHFSLLAPFSADERCRQIVFWVADWQAFEDFETMPGEGIDANKYPRSAPGEGNDFDHLLGFLP